jgi:hypothetical protein
MKHLTVLMAAILVLIGCSSQPRFTFIGNKDQASHRYEMFDNKTGKACWAGPVELNDGEAGLKDAIRRFNEAHPNQPLDPDSENPNPFIASSVLTADPYAFVSAEILDPKLREAKDRVERLKQHPEEQKIQVNGLPYCEDLK